MAIRLSWQKTPAKSLVNAGTAVYALYMRIPSTVQRSNSPAQTLCSVFLGEIGWRCCYHIAFHKITTQYEYALQNKYG